MWGEEDDEPDNAWEEGGRILGGMIEQGSEDELDEQERLKRRVLIWARAIPIGADPNDISVVLEEIGFKDGGDEECIYVGCVG